tara:strand:+ start:324 stop:536 length:213 start_codon:yes stop_codon:yes gene_type:complete
MIKIFKKSKKILRHYVFVRFMLIKHSDAKASLKPSKEFLSFQVFWFVVFNKQPRNADFELLSGNPCQVFA